MTQFLPWPATTARSQRRMTALLTATPFMHSLTICASSYTPLGSPTHLLASSPLSAEVLAVICGKLSRANEKAMPAGARPAVCTTRTRTTIVAQGGSNVTGPYGLRKRFRA